MARSLAAFPYGAVYFRKSNPPRADWERDYATAAQDGLNTFRHWFLWAAIEVAPGEFDWADYDAQLDLAARFGLKTVIAEFVTSAPEWAWRQLAHARYQAAAFSRNWSRATGAMVDSARTTSGTNAIFRASIAIVRPHKRNSGSGCETVMAT